MLLWNLYHSQFIRHKLLFKTAHIIHVLHHHCIKGTDCCCGERSFWTRWSSLWPRGQWFWSEIWKNSLKRKEKDRKLHILLGPHFPKWFLNDAHLQQWVDGVDEGSDLLKASMGFPVCSETHHHAGLRGGCFSLGGSMLLSWFCPLLSFILKRRRTSEGIYGKWTRRCWLVAWK